MFLPLPDVPRYLISAAARTGERAVRFAALKALNEVTLSLLGEGGATDVFLDTAIANDAQAR